MPAFHVRSHSTGPQFYSQVVLPDIKSREFIRSIPNVTPEGLRRGASTLKMARFTAYTEKNVRLSGQHQRWGTLRRCFLRDVFLTSQDSLPSGCLHFPAEGPLSGRALAPAPLTLEPACSGLGVLVLDESLVRTAAAEVPSHPKELQRHEGEEVGQDGTLGHPDGVHRPGEHQQQPGQQEMQPVLAAQCLSAFLRTTSSAPGQQRPSAALAPSGPLDRRRLGFLGRPLQFPAIRRGAGLGADFWSRRGGFEVTSLETHGRETLLPGDAHCWRVDGCGPAQHGSIPGAERRGGQAHLPMFPGAALSQLLSRRNLPPLFGPLEAD